jgi:hypothetical protein
MTLGGLLPDQRTGGLRRTQSISNIRVIAFGGESVDGGLGH